MTNCPTSESVVSSVTIVPEEVATALTVVGTATVADGGMVEVLGAGVVEADVVRGPAGAERLAPRREFADEV